MLSGQTNYGTHVKVFFSKTLFKNPEFFYCLFTDIKEDEYIQTKANSIIDINDVRNKKIRFQSMKSGLFL